MEFARTLKDSIDIARVIGEYVSLKKAGSTYKARCPFHTEKTPSFTVSPQHQWFHCFGCDKKGDVISFVMEIEALTFWEACKQLAERFGIPLPKRSFQSDEATKKRAGVFETHEAAQRIYRAALLGPAGAEARAYLQRRGVTPELAEEFGLGLAERGGVLSRKLQSDGFGADVLESSGLVIRRDDGSGYFDRFRSRLMFPIHNESGKLIAFAGRALSDEDQPKYLNSPETDIYKKSSVLYNLHRAKKAARQADQMILVEGYMDVIGLFGAGVHQVVASCGTALTVNQVRALGRHSEGVNVVVNFDPDPAGTSAAARSIQMLLEEGARIRVLELSGGLDPDEYVKENGIEAYRTALSKAPRYFEWLASRVRMQYDTRTAEGQIAAAKAMMPSLHRINDPMERSAFAEEVAGLLNIQPGMVLENFRKSVAARGKAAPKTSAPATPLIERLLWQHVLADAGARRVAVERLPSMTFASPPQTSRIIAALLAIAEDFNYTALEGRLGETDRALLASLAFADDAGEDAEQDPAAQVRACLDKLEAKGLLARRAELKARIKAAEKEGNLQQALLLSRELNEMDRQDKSTMPQPSRVVE